MLLLGFLLLAFLVYRMDPRQILAYTERIGWRFLLVVGVALCWQVGNTVAWGLSFNRGEASLRFRELFVAKLGGDAINHITPLLGLGGEFVKPYLIRRGAPLPSGFASIVITKTVQAITGVVYALVGVGLAFLLFDLPRFVWAATAGLIVAGAALVLWFFLQQRGAPFSSLLDLMARMGIRRLAAESRRRGVAEMDRQIATYYRRERGRFAVALAIHCASWTFGVLETWLIVRLLGTSIPFTTAFFLTSLSTIISTAFFFVPGGIGVSEGGQAFLFGMLGLPMSMGLTVGLVKRIRKVVYVLVGLLLVSGWFMAQPRGEAKRVFGMGGSV